MLHNNLENLLTSILNGAWPDNQRTKSAENRQKIWSPAENFRKFGRVGIAPPVDPQLDSPPRGSTNLSNDYEEKTNSPHPVDPQNLPMQKYDTDVVNTNVTALDVWAAPNKINIVLLLC